MSQRTGTNRIARHPVLGDDHRSADVQITFNGERLLARSGESISAALLAHGIAAVRTMPESESPRGYFCGAGRCPDCCVTVDGVLNVLACIAPVRDGMAIEAQQGFGTWKARDR